MNSLKLKFLNSEGQQISARLELPADSHPHSFAIFAHCFTCNKNLNAVRNISRALTINGIAVLRFDFTGLGESEGEFADTNFSSNIEDLKLAAEFLAQNYQAPKLMIGHSLGGAATIFAAAELPYVKAVVTVGAPASPQHVSHLFKSSLEEIQGTGSALVNIGGRDIRMKQQFLEDLQTHSLEETLSQFKKKAVLIMHSPIDTIVGINNARQLYLKAVHPKSFVSLDDADHLLTNKEDSLYVGQMIACWATKYIPKPELTVLKSEHEVVAKLSEEKFTTEIQAGRHGFIADEPLSMGGNDFGPSPYQLLASALGACTVMTLRMYADRKGWELEEVLVHLDHEKIEELSPNPDRKGTVKVDHFTRSIEIEGPLDSKQKERLLEIANKCPVHQTLQSNAKISTVLK